MVIMNETQGDVTMHVQKKIKIIILGFILFWWYTQKNVSLQQHMRLTRPIASPIEIKEIRTSGRIKNQDLQKARMNNKGDQLG